MKVLALPALLCLSSASAFAPVSTNSKTCTFTALNLKAEAAAAGGETETEKDILHSMPKKSRRAFLSTLTTTSTAAAAAIALTYLNPNPAVADVDVEAFINSGQVSMPMGVSGQAGKSRPQTGIVFRDGSETSWDSKSGNVLAEILLKAQSNDPAAVLVTFSSSWPLAKGSLFDVECRESQTGDSAFLSLSEKANGKSIQDLPTSFFLDKLFSSTGRFSFYGQPTDVKVKKSYMSTEGNNRVIELGFSILSQSTGAEIPRLAIVVATIPAGTDEAVMLATSSTATRWRKGVEKDVRKTAESFRAVAAPKTEMKVRARDTSYDVLNILVSKE